MLASHQRSWVWGRRLVEEILQAGRWPVLELYLEAGMPPAIRDPLIQRAEELGYVCHMVERQRLAELCPRADHQGCLARMGEYPYASLNDALKSRPGEAPLLCAMDGVQDAFNFGAIVRSAEVFGLHGMLIGEQGQCGVTSQAARSSAGAVNRFPIVRGESLPSMLRELRGQEIQIIGAAPEAAVSIRTLDLRRPAVLVLGGESDGISIATREECATLAAIPQQGRIGSLNVAAAAAVLFYEAMRQRTADASSVKQ